MGRFDADTEADRIELVVDAIQAHRVRESGFITVTSPTGGDDPDPWIQFDARDSVCNLDCTEQEFQNLEGLLDDFGGLTIRERTSPEGVDGTNVRIEARVDDQRVAQFVDQCFREVYELPDDYALWVTDI